MKSLCLLHACVFALICRGAGPRGLTDRVYGASAEGPLLLNIHLPQGAGPFPWLLRLSSSRERPDALGQRLLTEGVALVYASYDVEGNGRVAPPWPGVLSAIRQSVRHLHAHACELGLDTERAAVWGWSRGGYAAALAAATEWVDEAENPAPPIRFRACITLAGSFGYVDPELLGQDLHLYPRPGHAYEAEARVSQWVTPDMPPTLSLRGGNDGSPDDLLAFHQTLRAFGVPSRHLLFPGMGHGVGGGPATEAILEWLEIYLLPAAPAKRPAVEDLHVLLEAGAFFQARRRHPEAEAAIAEAELLHHRRRVAERLALDPAFWSGEYQRWRELHGEGAVWEEAEARIEATGTAVGAWRRESARRLGETKPWPENLPVPGWAQAHGVDGFGPHASLRLPGEPELLLRFRRLGDLGWLAETELTQAAYERITGTNPAHVQGDLRRPAERINHEAALRVCALLREAIPGLPVRLPRAAEWRAAFGAESGRPPLSAVAWTAVNSGGTTHPVGSLAPNERGFYDLQGNVFEWLGDERRERPMHYRSYAGGSFVSRAERCDPDWIVAHNGANTTFYHGMRLWIDP